VTVWLAAAATAAAPVHAQTLAPANGAPLNAAPPQTQAYARVSVGEREDFTRLSFIFPAAATMTLAGRGDALELRFSRTIDVDLAEVHADLPRFVRSIEKVSNPGQPLRVALQLEPGVRERHFIDGARVNVDLLAPATPQPTTQISAVPARAPPAAAQPPPPPPSPAPTPPEAPYVAPRGPASVQVSETEQASRIVVRWDSPARAAAFRRGEAVWLLFQSDGQIDLRGLARAGRRFSDMEIVRGEGVVGLRLPVARDTFVAARADGAAWEFTLSGRARETPGAPVSLSAADDGNRLAIAFGRDGAVKAIADPEIGDRILVAFPAGAPIGVTERRATLEAAILPTTVGAAIEPRADGVEAAFRNGQLLIGRGAGLIANTPPLVPDDAEASRLPPQLSERQIRDRIDALTRSAASEGVGEGAPCEARMALARFLLANELAPETLGALRIAEMNQPGIELDPEFRLVRAAANVMMGRADAQPDLSAEALLDDPTAALWRGYLAAESQNWSEAQREFARGAGALETQPPNWRARFALAQARAALELNDLNGADVAARNAIGQAQAQPIRLQARLLQARIMAARGRNPDAARLFDELSRSRDEEVAVRAQMEAVKLGRQMGAITPAVAADRLEALRYRWRGDEIEIETVSTLGEIYAGLHRWRDALVTMRVVASRYPNAPQSRQLREDMQTIFTQLFLDGGADSLEPIQALGLFYEFADLTPIGPDGDRLVRRLSGRLVSVDLLEQAATLLQYQVDNRLDGVGRARAASDLAAIYLMDRKSEKALLAIANTRVANMPPALLAERRILEARAQMDLARLENAVELVERDQSLEAQRVRAEAAWRARDWTRAGVELRRLLATRPQSQTMDQEWRQVVLRAAVALSMEGDEAGVRQLYREHAGDLANTDEGPAFEIATGGQIADGVALRELARVIGRADLIDRFLNQLRTRMTGGAPAPAPSAPPAT